MTRSTLIPALVLASCLGLASGSAFARQVVQEETVRKDNSGTTGGAVAGAVAGAVVAGPVGAVVGGVAGAVAGHTIAPPTEVRTYVTTQEGPTIAYGHPVVVGRTVDGDITWRDVPDYPRYRWASLDGHRVVVDADTRDVVAVY